MPTYTAFCRDITDRNSTTWIESFEASDETEARKLAVQSCTDAWNFTGDNADNVGCIGLALGDVQIVYWDDAPYIR